MISFVLTLFFLGFAHLVAITSLAGDFHFLIRGEFARNSARRVGLR